MSKNNVWERLIFFRSLCLTEPIEASDRYYSFFYKKFWIVGKLKLFTWYTINHKNDKMIDCKHLLLNWNCCKSWDDNLVWWKQMRLIVDVFCIYISPFFFCIEKRDGKKRICLLKYVFEWEHHRQKCWFMKTYMDD